MSKNLKAENEQLAADLDAMTEYAAEADALIEFVTGELAIASFKSMIMEGLLEAASDYVRNAEDEKTRVALIAERRAKSEALPCIGKLALQKSFNIMVDGLDITVEPETTGRLIETVSQIGEDGKIYKTVSVLKGAALFGVYLPMFGEVVMRGTLERTETSYGENPRYLDIKNVAKFALVIGGVERTVTIAAEGDIDTATGGGFEYGASAEVTGHRCMWCGRNHRDEVFEAYITIG